MRSAAVSGRQVLRVVSTRTTAAICSRHYAQDVLVQHSGNEDDLNTLTAHTPGKPPTVSPYLADKPDGSDKKFTAAGEQPGAPQSQTPAKKRTRTSTQRRLHPVKSRSAKFERVLVHQRKSKTHAAKEAQSKIAELTARLAAAEAKNKDAEDESHKYTALKERSKELEYSLAAAQERGHELGTRLKRTAGILKKASRLETTMTKFQIVSDQLSKDVIDKTATKNRVQKLEAELAALMPKLEKAEKEVGQLTGTSERLSETQKELQFARTRLGKAEKTVASETAALKAQVAARTQGEQQARKALASELNKSTQFEKKIADVSNDYKQAQAKVMQAVRRQIAAETNLGQMTRRLGKFSREAENTRTGLIRLQAELQRYQLECDTKWEMSIVDRLLHTIKDMDNSQQRDAISKPILRLQEWLYRSDRERDNQRKNQQEVMKSMTRHEDIAKEPDILRIYSDGAQYSMSSSGGKFLIRAHVDLRVTCTDESDIASAVAPLHSYARLSRILPNSKENLGSGITELEGLALALETASILAKPNQRVVLFTDSHRHSEQHGRMWYEDPRKGESSPLKRAAKALLELEERGATVHLSWLAKDCVIIGSRLAHGLARQAAALKEPYFLELSDDYWSSMVRDDALQMARDWCYHSDTG